MPTTTAYTLEQFAADMQELVKSRPDQATIFERGLTYLERFIRSPFAIAEEHQRPLGRGKRPNHSSYVLRLLRTTL